MYLEVSSIWVNLLIISGDEFWHIMIMLKGLDFDLQHSIYVKVVNIDIGSSSLTFYIDIIGPLQSYTIYIIRAVKISIMEVFDRVRDGLSGVHRSQVYVL